MLFVTQLDFGNAIRLGDDALDAANACCETLAASVQPDLPQSVGFERAGILVRRTASLVTYISSDLGGVVVSYHRNSAGGWCLVREDSGYLLKSQNKTDSWLTRVPGAGKLMSNTPERVVIEAQFYRSLHDDLTPMRMVALRLLNLTLLRVQWIGDLFRKFVVARLMGDREVLPLTLTREIQFSVDTVTIRDRIVSRGTLGGVGDSALYRCRRVTGLHMASARYFQEQELKDVGAPWLERVADSVTKEFTSQFEIGHG